MKFNMDCSAEPFNNNMIIYACKIKSEYPKFDAEKEFMSNIYYTLLLVASCMLW